MTQPIPTNDIMAHVKLHNQEEENARKAFNETRKALREELAAEALLGLKPKEYFVTFSGYGDSGDLEPSGYPENVQDFFYSVLDTLVDYDWYNNDGGYGDITWDVMTDTLTINGYQYETTTHPVMVEEEF